MAEIMMMIELRTKEFCDLALLNRIKADPDISQALLAEALKISIGTVNGHLKRMVEEGLIEVKQARRRKLRYIITEEGCALHNALMEDYLQQSFQLYRQVRQQAKVLLQELDGAGVQAVRLQGEGDVADVCRLTCLENQVCLTDDHDAPALVVDGLDISIEWPRTDHLVKMRQYGETDELV